MLRISKTDEDIELFKNASADSQVGFLEALMKELLWRCLGFDLSLRSLSALAPVSRYILQTSKAYPGIPRLLRCAYVPLDATLDWAASTYQYDVTRSDVTILDRKELLKNQGQVPMMLVYKAECYDL